MFAAPLGRPAMPLPRRDDLPPPVYPVSARLLSRPAAPPAPPAAIHTDSTAARLLAARRTAASPLLAKSPRWPSKAPSSVGSGSVQGTSTGPGTKRPRLPSPLSARSSSPLNATVQWIDPPAKRRAIGGAPARDLGAIGMSSTGPSGLEDCSGGAITRRQRSASDPRMLPTTRAARLQDRAERGPFALETLAKVAPLHGLLMGASVDAPPRAVSLPPPDRPPPVALPPRAASGPPVLLSAHHHHVAARRRSVDFRLSSARRPLGCLPARASVPLA